MSPRIEIEGGAGPEEAAAILAAFDQLLRELARSAAGPPAPPRRNAWVNARRSEPPSENGRWSLSVGQGEGLGA